MVSEIAANAILHGRPAPKTIGARVDVKGVDLVIAITDDGGPFEGASQRMSAGGPSDPLSPTGRGLTLVRAALDRTHYRVDGTNCFIGHRSLRRRRATALVVEDTPSLLETYTETLQHDYRVIGCSSFEEAKAALRDSSIDVVLADVHLGDGLGAELPEEIATLDGGALPVVLISSDTSTSMREAALRLGAEFYLSKPVRPQALRDAVALALSRAAVRDARLARRFTRHIDGFITSVLPPTMGAYRVESAAGTPSAGGGDLVVHLPLGDGDRIVLIDVVGHGVAARAWAVAYAAIVRTLHHCAGSLSAAEFLTELARVAWTEPTLDARLRHRSGGRPRPRRRMDRLGRPPAAAHLRDRVSPRGVAQSVARRRAARTASGGTNRARPRRSNGPVHRRARSGGRGGGRRSAGMVHGGAPGRTDRTARQPRHEAAAGDRIALGPQPSDDWTVILVERTAGP